MDQEERQGIRKRAKDQEEGQEIRQMASGSERVSGGSGRGPTE
jgi:hypothetical protein